MNLKMRKFFKKILKVKYFIVLLLVVLVVVVISLYTKKDLVENKLVMDNIAFNTEGFKSFNGVDEPILSDKTGTWVIGDVDTGIKGKQDVKEIDGYWWIGDTNTNIKATMDSNRIVADNDKFRMFMDEMSTIVTVVDKTSLIPGKAGDNPDDYIIKYSSANENGSISQKANFSISYANTRFSGKKGVSSFNSYSSSVNFENVLTKLYERHYEIKYLEEENAVQVYYTIGNFGSIDTYFSQKIYATVYEPARCYYESDEAHQAAVEKYESEYLSVVGDLDSTFEERFRGNVQTIISAVPTDEGDRRLIQTSSTIYVYSQEARDYLIDTVLPEMAAEGYDIIEYDKEILDEEARDAAGMNKEGAIISELDLSSVKWKMTVPVELVDYYGEYYKKYFNNENSPLTNNPFLTKAHYDTIQGTSYKYVKKDGKDVPVSYYILNITKGQANTLYSLLYGETQSVTTTTSGKEQPYFVEINGEEVPYTSSGFVQKDDEGNYVYDENGNVKKQLFSIKQVTMDNNMFGIETAGLPVFKIGLQFKLTDKGFEITIPRDSLLDTTNVKKDHPDYKILTGGYQIYSVSLCPYMTYVDTTQEGYIIVPDGSGAKINFNNGKVGTVSGRYYGNDNAYVDLVQRETSVNLLLGMYGFINTTPENPSGLLSIIEKGGGQISLIAGVDASSSYAYYNAILRGKEDVITGTVADNATFGKYDKELTPSDIVINYQFIDEDHLDYSSVAKQYQEYIMERDGLQYNDKTNNVLNDLQFLGTFDEYALLLGIKYKTTGTLTTFDQAQAILEELSTKGVSNISVSYKGWTNENLEYELGGKLKVAKELGKTTTINKFYEYCVSKGVTFYPEVSITKAKGYDFAFGSSKYSARGVGNEEAIHYEYDLSSGRQNKKLNPTYVISPIYYKSIVEKITSDFQKLNIWTSKENGGYYLSDLGNQWSGNYRVGRQVYGGDAVLYQQEALSMLSQGNKIKIDAPCDYAFKYVDIATNIPMTSSMYTIYDQTIPFYQLVVNGLFDYTTEQINGLSNKSSSWYFAKALETGSNLSYILSAEDPAILLKTDYTQYYQAYYNNWNNIIVNFSNEIDSLKLHECYLTSHEMIGDFARVTYSNKIDSSKQIVLIINTKDTTKTYNGNEISGYGYIVEQ